MSWTDLHGELAEMFDGYSWRADDMERALEEWGAWRVVQQADIDRERSRPADYRAKRRKYMREYRAARPDVRAANIARTREWREQNRDHARALMRAAEKRKRERAKTDPVFREKFLAQRRESRRRTREKDPARWNAKRREQVRAYRARRRAAMEAA